MRDARRGALISVLGAMGVASCANLGGLTGGAAGGVDGGTGPSTDAGQPPSDANQQRMDRGRDTPVTEGSPAGCPEGYVTCPPSPAGSCETFPAGDPRNCGACNGQCLATRTRSAPACVDGKCVVDCADGFADCDGDPSNGCEADLSTDPKNCGTCGDACQVGACAGGVCGPQVLGPADSTYNNPVFDDDANLYWIFNDNLVTCAKTGCSTPTILIASLYNPMLVFDGTTFFEADNNGNTMVACAKTGCNKSPATVATGVLISFLAVGSDAFYFVDTTALGNTYKIRSCPKTGCTGTAPVLVASAGSLVDEGQFETAGSTLLWSNAEGVRGCTLPACATVTTIAPSSDGFPPQFSTDGQNTLYFTSSTGTTVYSCPFSGCGAGPTLFSTAANEVDAPPIAVDGTELYVATSEGFARCPETSCVAPMAVPITVSPTSTFAIDATSIYWIGNSELLRIPK